MSLSCLFASRPHRLRCPPSGVGLLPSLLLGLLAKLVTRQRSILKIRHTTGTINDP